MSGFYRGHKATAKIDEKILPMRTFLEEGLIYLLLDYSKHP